MDTWIVTRKPIGMYKPPIRASSPNPTQEVRASQCTQQNDSDRLEQKITFFFKAHIMAGQVRPGKSVKDFVWVTKQEIKTRVKKDYWEGVKDMLSDH